MTFLGDHATAIGAAVTAAGGVLYVLLSVISSRVYDPIGVTPAQVGLGYGPMLLGAATLLLWLAAVIAVFAALTLAAIWLAGKLGRWWWVLVALFALLAVAAVLAVDAATAALTASVALGVAAGRRQAGRRYVAGAAVAVAFGLVTGVGAIYWWADRARDDMATGFATSGGLRGPWVTQVVSVHPVEGSELPTDRCLLYLGEADGMSVLHDPGGEGRTWRVPTTDLQMEIHPDAALTTDCKLQ